jgi:hypothetical protein
MKVEALNQIDRDEARGMWRKYQEHRAYQSPYDEEIAAIYKRIAQGKTVIRALESIRAAGFDADGLPKLAICPAHMTECWYQVRGGPANRSVRFGKRSPATHETRAVVRFDWPNAPETKGWDHCAQVPLIPVHLRPKRGLQNYHILWDAEWAKRYPVDPYLLRRFGGDAWLVVAAWDLTDVERAVMSSRVRS